ncbi:hypothetical protein LCGC14_2267580 [marine sediment metagenome]|uniref:Lipoprotein n=1 Tax=marine sediment metagenome TaxID=412755 RepID=A0A0F9DK59_9ZZZZ
MKNIKLLSLFIFALSCSSVKTGHKERKTQYQTESLELPLINNDISTSTDKVISISKSIGFKKLTQENEPWLKAVTDGYYLEYSKDSLTYWIDIDTLSQGKIKMKFIKEKSYLKKISSKEFKELANQTYSRIKNEYIVPE